MVAGLPISVAVAWLACWRMTPLPSGVAVFDRENNYVGIIDHSECVECCRYFYTFAQQETAERGKRLPRPRGWLSITPFVPSDVLRGPRPPFTIDVYASGWPLPCVRRASISPPYTSMARVRETGWKVRGVWLPTLPYWPGLLADAAFWGLPVPLMVLGVAALRRARRRRGGLCVGCGYDLAGVASRCPECGAEREQVLQGHPGRAPTL